MSKLQVEVGLGEKVNLGDYVAWWPRYGKVQRGIVVKITEKLNYNTTHLTITVRQTPKTGFYRTHNITLTRLDKVVKLGTNGPILETPVTMYHGSMTP